MNPMKMWLMVVLCAVLALTVGVATATASGGNSDAAHFCQHGGWQYLLTADQTPFANDGHCVSYAARGGQFYSNTPLMCDSFGGTYSTNPNTSLFSPDPGQSVIWTCNGFADPGGANGTALALACLFTDGGQGFTNLNTDPDYSTCWLGNFTT